MDEHEQVSVVQRRLTEKIQDSDAETPDELAQLFVDEMRQTYLIQKVNSITTRLLELRDNDTQHYSHAKIESMDDVYRALEGGADELNWVFVGTGGIHGDYETLDSYPERDEFTVLIVRPRTVSCLYGVIEIEDQSDAVWLRKHVEATANVICETQEPNWADDPPYPDDG